MLERHSRNFAARVPRHPRPDGSIIYGMIDAKSRFISLSSYTVAPENIPTFTDAARTAMEHDVAAVEGLLAGIVMVDDVDPSAVLIVTEWDAKQSWVHANYEPRIGAVVAGFVQGAMHYDVHTYESVTIVRN